MRENEVHFLKRVIEGCRGRANISVATHPHENCSSPIRLVPFFSRTALPWLDHLPMASRCNDSTPQ